MGLVRLAVTRPVTTLMLLVSVLVMGAIASQRLPLAFLPEIDVPFIAVEVPYPNSNPSQVEHEVTEPVEEALATLSGVKSLRSTSTADGATFVLEFRWGQSLDVVRMQVSEKIEAVKAELPPGAQNVVISSFNTSDIPVVESRIAARGVDLSANYPLIETHVLDRLRRVPGVARVDLGGVEPRHVFVDLVQARLEEHKIDVGDLVDRLTKASGNQVLGRAGDGDRRFTARGLGAFTSLEDLGDFPIGKANLRLRDIAEINYEEPPLAYGRHLDREDAVALSVYKESTANTVDVVDEVLRVIEDDINSDPALAGVQLFVWENQAEQIRAGIDGLRRAGLIGAGLAVLCLYVFLRRMSSTLLVALTIPFSLVAATAVMYFMGRSLNLLSMMGLMIGIGMLVDNAIVVLEAIDRQGRDEPDPAKAALRGAGSVVTAVVAATVTTLIVFLPLVVGASTDLTTWLGEVGLTISLTLVCSLISSLTLIPLVAARLKRRPQQQARAHTLGLAERVHGAIVRWTLRRRGWATLGLVLGLAIGAVPFAAEMVKTDVFSAQVNKRLSLRYDFDDFHYKFQSEDVVDEIESYLYDNADSFGMESVYSYFAENQAGTTIILARQDLDDDEIKALRAKIRAGLPQIPGARVSFFEDADSGGSSTYFSVQLYGRDGEVLRGLSEDTETLLRDTAGIRDVSTSFKHGRAEIEVAADTPRTDRRGVTARNAADAFAFTLGGTRLPRFRDGEREVDVWLALRIEDRASLQDLRAIQFVAKDGPPVRLGEFSEFSTKVRPTEILRQDRRGNAWVRATYEGKDWGEVRTQLEEKLKAMDLPPGYSWSWDRRTVEQDDQAEQMGTNFLLALLLVYLVLASLFESATQPLAILFSIVAAVPGAAWMLAATGTPLNLMAQIGLLILMGVVVNNGVVYLDRVNALRRSGMERDEAFVVAGRDRLRPIVMTAVTTIVGLAPLALGGAMVGGLFYYPLARAIMGGLMSSAVFTLIGLPLVTVGVEGVAGWFGRLWRVSTPV